MQNQNRGEKLRQLRELANLAAKTGLNMTETDESMFSPWQEPDQKHYPDDAVYSSTVPRTITPEASDTSLMQQRAEQENKRAEQARKEAAQVADTAKRIALGVSLERLRRELPEAVIIRAQEAAKYVVLSNQEITALENREVGAIRQGAGRQRAKNGGNKQVSEADFLHVFDTQLQLLSQGKNLTANEVLRTAYPDGTDKATRIGNSARWKRIKKVYQAQVQNHPIEQAMLKMHGKRCMKQRFSTRKFRHFLGLTQTMFNSYIAITDRDELKRNAATLEQQTSSAQHRAALIEAGVTLPRDKAIELYIQGTSPTEIAKTLGEKYNTVKSWIQKHRASLRLQQGAE